MKWWPTTIGELVERGVISVQTGPFGSQLHAHDYRDAGVPVVPTEAIRNRRIDRSVCPVIDQQKAATLVRHRLEVGDILFARRGVQATGHIGVVRAAEAGFVCGTGAIRLRVAENDLVDAEYLSHVLADPASISWFKHHAIGATMPNLNEGIIKSFPLSLPSIQYQHRVAAIMSAMDDKIELNKRTNETLEVLAQAIFGDWFVDFGPVRRKLAGERDPVAIMGGITLDPVKAAKVAALFPDALDGNAQPTSWRVYALGELADLSKKTTAPSNQPNDLFAHYSLPAFDAGVGPAMDWGADIKSNKTVVPPGAVLLSKLNPEIPRVWIPDEPNGTTPVCSTEFLVLMPSAVSNRSLLYSLFGSHSFRKTLEGMVTGTSKSHQRVNPTALLNVNAVLGTSAIFEAFGQFADPLIARRLAASIESRTLAETRDYLLPRLMSGKVRVAELETPDQQVRAS
ncbi:MAG: restriction endonuclease subunit S [Hyphomonadaceae bacterium]